MVSGIFRTSQFFPPTNGDVHGTCVVCGFATERGHKVDFSDNFTSWNLLQEGDCICEFCYTLCRDQQYRRKSWVATPEHIRFLQRTEILKYLTEPPHPPFAIYITKSGKKQGFLHLINRVNYSREHYYLAYEDTLLFVTRSDLVEMADVAAKARALKFSKKELLTEPTVKHWEHRELCEQIIEFSKNPVWEVVVYAIR